MHLKIIPRGVKKTPDCLREALCLPGAGRLFQQQILEHEAGGKPALQRLFVPSQWLDQLDKRTILPQGFGFEGLALDSLNGALNDGLLLSNARLICYCDIKKLNALLNPSVFSVIAVEIKPELAAPNDLIRQTSQNHIVGYRRILEDIVEPGTILETDFPAFLYFPPSILQLFNRSECIPLEFEELRTRLDQKGIPLQIFRMGGRLYDLSDLHGLLYGFQQIPADRLIRTHTAAVDASARLIGPVWLGDGVIIDTNAIVAGPAILCEGVHIGSSAIVQNVIVAPKLVLESRARLRNTFFISHNSQRQTTTRFSVSNGNNNTPAAYRDWPLFSYPRLGKRTFDFVFSLTILLMISPVLVVVALMLKLTSPGPVFYRARRQGRCGREFDCLKFRSMMVRADTLQERLRDINQVDGPQFKIENDPRITGFGKFLRDTCIDELPQFINVLFGQMSVVGPRPSPENENEACPAWRDARLSVRPGITGLWQVCRTRQAEIDFQEWIYYDTQYVRNLSFRQDLQICLKTASKLIHTFLDQFG